MELSTNYRQDLYWADQLALWAPGAVTINAAVSGYQSRADRLATEQIKNAGILGSLTDEDILTKTNAAEAGAEMAVRTAVLKGVMDSLGTASLLVAVGATGYSAGARLNAAGRALYDSF